MEECAGRLVRRFERAMSQISTCSVNRFHKAASDASGLAATLTSSYPGRIRESSAPVPTSMTLKPSSPPVASHSPDRQSQRNPHSERGGKVCSKRNGEEPEPSWATD